MFDITYLKTITTFSTILIDRGVTKLAFSDSYQSAVTDNFDLPNCISNLSPEAIEAPEVISLPD